MNTTRYSLLLLFPLLVLTLMSCGDSTSPNGGTARIATVYIVDTIRIDDTDTTLFSSDRRPAPGSTFTLAVTVWDDAGSVTSQENHIGVVQHLSQYMGGSL